MPETTPAPARAPNPNRDLPADQVVALFRQKLPRAMLAGLTADREWLWWSGEKPEAETRALLVEVGFEFTPRAHPVTLRDGSAATAHWFHSCGGYVKRGGRGKGRITKPAHESPASEPSQPITSAPVAESDTVSSFLRLASTLQ